MGLASPLVPLMSAALRPLWCQGRQGHVIRPVMTECQSASVQQDSEATALSGHLPAA